ncbi:MAG: glycosyltransferase family 2 protein [Acidobacteria bacterium]|nr:glycosyltransferase family 2 protein [Acidobacteriota bacterium]
MRAIDSVPPVSVIIPARNEERAIEATVQGFLNQTWQDLEIVVVDDRSSDATPRILAGISSSRLIVVEGTATPEGWLGKPWALQQGASRARGDVLIFCDADVRWEPQAVAAAVTTLLSENLDGLTIFPRLVMKGFWEHVLMGNLPLALVAYLPLWLFNRNQFTTMTVGSGVGNVVTREAWMRAGTHEALKNAVVDDVGLMRRVRLSGGRVQIFRASHLASIRMYHGLGEIVRGFTKNAWYAFGGRWSVFALASASMVFHVLPYVAAVAMVYAVSNGLAVPSWVSAGCAALVLLTAVRVVAFRSLGYRMDNALFGHPLMTVVFAWIALRSAWMNGVRRKLEWRGRSFDAGAARSGLG